MNLLCPNCQKMLTVPEQFAGQLMKCPLCSGTFTVPGLPGAAPPPPSAPSLQPSEAGTDIYSFRSEPEPPAPPPPPIQSVEAPLPSSKPDEPAPSLAPLPPGDYQHSAVAWLSPKVLPWIAPACLLLVFVLTFFTWVGLYPGGVPSVTQSAWGAAFGAYTEDGNLKSPPMRDEKYRPGWSVLTIFYLLLFFVTLVVTIASVVVDLVPGKLPPQVQPFLPWRWAAVAALNLVVFLFLALQLLVGFSLDNRYAEWVEKQVKVDNKEPKSTQQQMKEDSNRGIELGKLHHTFALHFVVLLHLIAIVSAALMFWLHQRGTHRPLPKLELRW